MCKYPLNLIWIKNINPTKSIEFQFTIFFFDCMKIIQKFVVALFKILNMIGLNSVVVVFTKRE